MAQKDLLDGKRTDLSWVKLGVPLHARNRTILDVYEDVVPNIQDV